jgi:hypothetical protein
MMPGDAHGDAAASVADRVNAITTFAEKVIEPLKG